MRVLFFGTSDFAVPGLHALIACGRHDVLAVVTQPDRPHGRGLQVGSSAVKHVALQLGLPLLQPRRVRSTDFVQMARDLAPDAFALAAFGQIIPQALLDLPPKGPVNVHGSLLPAYRGAAPIQHAILNGEQVTGVTTMWMDATLDTGDILLTRTVAIDPDDTTGTLAPRMAGAGAELLIETLDLLERGECPRVQQDNALATFAPSIAAEDTLVRWDEPAERTRNRIRAFSPQPGVFARFNHRRIKLWRAATASGQRGDPGTILSASRTGVIVAAGTDAVELLEVQPENGRRMGAADWARGARAAPGDRFEGASLP